jgi:hypothetical protein
MLSIHEIVLVLSPLLFAGILIALFPRIKAMGDWSKAIAPTFFLAVSLHFALFANLMASELWSNVLRANQAVRNEVNGLRSMLQIGVASLGGCSVKIMDSVKYYVDEVTAHEFQEEPQAERNTQPFPLSKVYRLMVIDPDFVPNETMKSLFKDSIELVRFNHYERLSLKGVHISPFKLGALFIFGLLTQIAIGVYHASNRPALIYSSTLFSICFSLTLLVMMILDSPYRYPYLVSPAPFGDASEKPFLLPEN